ncbi:hypothetical protein GCM10023198_56290 [Promicromonospora umidemergens]|uniref:Uncharacterized protein n=1 Tax=Promicromonospora umidemergens TaxID=629679 RepID=A0ABP8YA74_9MICO
MYRTTEVLERQARKASASAGTTGRSVRRSVVTGQAGSTRWAKAGGAGRGEEPGAAGLGTGTEEGTNRP